MDEITTEVVETTENENSPESSTETTETVTPSSGSTDSQPFHENPKILDFIDRQTEKKIAERDAKYQEEIEALRTQVSRFTPQDDVEIPEEAKMFGLSDPDAYKNFKSYLDKRDEAVRQGTLQAFEQKQLEERKREEEKIAAENKAREEALSYMENTLAEIESDQSLNPTGEKLSKSERNKLLKYTEANNLITSDGKSWDYRKAYRFMKLEEANGGIKEEVDRKRIAGATTSPDKGDTTPPIYQTPESMRKIRWR